VETNSVRGKNHVECHQVLHGYDDGHQLLASSLPLPRSVRTRMLLLTDLSGPSLVQGFETYLTGYPLPHEGLYAFSRTWYAEEMPRPGCVWTHTLFLSGEMLGSLSDLSALNRLFIKPGKADLSEGFSAYQAPVKFEVEINSRVLNFDVPEEKVRQIIAALYGQPDASVIIGAERAVDLERAVLAIWSQQWPNLRRSFSFCTGSLGLRSSADVRFDLQIVPQTHVRQFRRDADPHAFVGEEAIDGTFEGEDWVDATVNDLASSTLNSLRDFMWEFGPEDKNCRAVFQALCCTYLLAGQGPLGLALPQKLLDRLGRSFPKAEDAHRLKNYLLGYPGGVIGGQKRPSEEQVAVIKLLLANGWQQCLAPEILNPRARAQGLWHTDPTRALSLGEFFIDMENKEMPQEFIQGLAQVLQPEDIFRPEIQGAILSRVLAAQPRFAESPLAWQQPSDRQIVVIRSLSASDVATRELVIAAWKAALTAGSDVPVRENIGSEDKTKAVALLEWLAERQDKQAEEMACRWKDVLIGQDDSVLHFLSRCAQPSPPLVLASALALSPSVDVSGLDMLIWERVPRFFDSTIDGQNTLRAACFVLRKGLEASKPEGGLLVSHVFGLIYDAAERDALTDGSWGVVSSSLPGLWGYWDKCERLIHGVVRKFSSGCWPIDHFFLTFKKPKQLERALHYAKKDWWTRDYFLKVCRAFHDNELSITPNQAEVLRSVC